MTVLHSGTTKKYSNNWAQAFGQKKASGSAKSDTSKKKPAKKTGK
ncbi:MAG: hypothetical protein AB7F89_05240 [Pirellulaceae bacterium]